MTEEEQHPEDENIGPKQFTDKSANQILAILFVLGVYFVIMLKILFIA
jgi:hypothetical protein